MKKDLKDYLHLYLGCECQTPDGGMILSYYQPKKRYKAWFSDDHDQNRKILQGLGLTGKAYFEAEIKPILRSLSDITDEEKNELRKLMTPASSKNLLPVIPAGRLVNLFVNDKDPAIIVWLLSKFFDLFDLLGSGLAIDKKTMK